ncbi:MAG: TonB-dependent receptor [Rikenellaceae bacterium]
MKHLTTLKRAFSLLCMLFVFQTTFAQVEITGRVVDEQGESLIGVAVMVEGGTQGTVSDIDGNFNLNVPSEESSIVISYIGYEAQTHGVGARTNFNIVLIEDSKTIDDVVVVGYGVQKKSHLTGSVSKYSNENMADMAVTSVDQALQGRIAGVNITNTTSEAGSSPQIRVRGMGSISASNEPLVVVDGYPSSDGLAMVDMNDVESVEVLKDAASAAIYGSRGANGVIIVTTKSGNVQKPKFSVKAYTGVKSAYALHDMMSTDEYLTMLYDEADKGGSSVGTQQRLWDSFGWEDTNWQELAMNDNARISSVSLGVSGGKGDTKYYLSSSYTSDDGIMLNSTYDKFNVRFKLDTKLSDAVSIGVNMAPTYSKKESNTAGFIDFVRTYSWMPLYHNEESAALTGKEVGDDVQGRDFNSCDFSYIDDDGVEQFVEGQSAWGTSNNNPYYKMMNDRRYYSTYALQTSAYLDIKFTDDLTFRTSNGFYVKKYGQERYHNANTSSEGDSNYALLYDQFMVDLLSENTLNYNKDFGKHSLSALVGYTANTTSYDYSQIYGTGFPTDLVPTLNAATSITLTDEDGDRVTYSEKEEEVLVSLLSRVSYSYDDKYLASVSLRADGSSKFGPDNQWGYFPSASIGWRVTEEPFMENVNFMNQLKLRASWGITGTNDIDNYAAYNTLSGSDYTFGASSSTVTAGLTNTSSTLGNTYISWEQTEEYNYGADMSFLGSRINFSVDYYYSITKSMLLEQPTVAYTGYTNYWNNIGRVRNKGFEFDISTYNIVTPNFQWNTNLNISFNDNRLIELGDSQTELLSYGERSEIYIAQVGGPSIQFYGYETDGIWLSQDQIDNSGLTFAVGNTPVAGTLKLVDQNGDGIINADDRTTLGTPFADYTWGLTNTFKYKNVDLSFQLYGSMGGQVMNGDVYYSEIKKFNTNFTTNRFISEEYPGDGKTPTFSTSGFTAWELTDYLIEDASYMTLRDLTVGYTFGKKVLEKIHLSKLRVYATGQNLFYLWSNDYTGINPEARKTDSEYSSSLVSGYQRGVYPISKTITFGAEVNF